MTQNDNIVNYPENGHTLPASGTTAPLQNVALCNRLLEQAMNRPSHLPGIVAFYGFSGLGKSISAAYVANKTRAFYIECKSTWTRKALLRAILKEMNIDPANTNYEMVDQIGEELTLSGRPLIVDEMDYLVEKKAVNVIMDIYEASNAAILLIGEENLPTKLRKLEKFHNRVLTWELAQPANLTDTKHLAKLYCKEVAIADDLLQRIQEASRGTVRRICVNLHRVQQVALSELGQDSITNAEWGKRELYTGEAPARRV